ncbi:hypothetical protein [Zhihengliuella halotolerans]|uniref:hypothetical protein n=1 Tax=Zhihengliuella halotolerans TaxID=370736 RepID=UPI000C8047DB|nr:hypothetical protein [Zhihengliuella halotolerans]
MSSTEALPEGWSEREIESVRLIAPEAWETLEPGDATFVLAHPEAEGMAFRSNVVVRESEFAGSLAALAAYSLASTRAVFNNCHFISYDLAEIDGTEARRQRFTYDADGFNLIVERFLVARGGYALEITTTSPVHLAAKVLEGNSLIAGSIRWARTGAVPGPGTRDVDTSTGEREPRHDEWLSELAGHPVEDLSKLPASQSFDTEGPLFSDSTIAFLITQFDRHGLGRFELMAHPQVVEELVAGGLMEPGGAFTPTLELMLDALRDRDFSVKLTGRHHGTDTRLQIHAGAGRAFVLAGAPAAEIVHGKAPRGATPEGKVRADVVPVEGLPALIAAWAGLGPAWTVAGDLDTLTHADYERGVDGQLTAPADCDAATARLFAQPWFAWNMEIEKTPFARSWLNAGAAGHYAVGAQDDGTVAIQPVPALQVWDVLLHELGAATLARPAAK